MNDANMSLVGAAALNFMAAALHFGCIAWGANGYRFLGAGEPIVTWAARGHWYPPLLALVIGAAFTILGIYALSAAGLVGSLPFSKFILVGITAIYLLRAVAFPLLKPIFPGNSVAFWLITSGICLVMGLLHLIGVVQTWKDLS